ncbi:transglycosylase SLT domain-containing protein [Herminiimonas sp. CN]|uniref:transglycosylase SLT domain-containing protein n=1 Tax=Herminiimonas sp. CN TaxID=1349818 RepID=UPI000473E09B|nr:transglycosylase SLT domain-containing protein [Herminiimonas sp. CN]
MALRHDAQGFLIGNPIELETALKDWAAIREDVRAIRHALTSGAPTSPARSGRAPGAPGAVARPTAPASSGSDHQIPALLRPPATPQTGGTGAQKRDSQAVAAVGQAVIAAQASQKASARAAAKPASRDGRGRFVGRGGSGGDGRAPGAPGGGDERDEVGGLRGVADRIAGAIKESGSGMEEADPTIKAFNEVAQPMARGYELLTGGNKDKRQEGWLRRIWTSLTGFRNDETTFSKAANKSLKAIEEKSKDGGKGDSGMLGGLMGGLGGMLTRIPVIGPLFKGAGRMLGFGGKEVAAVAGGAGAATKEAGLLGKAGGLLKEGSVLSKAGGLLKRIPLLGTLLSVGGAAADLYDSESDDSLTRRDKDKRAGKAVGGAAGSLGGMAAGAAAGAAIGSVVPIIGTAIGGIIGGAVGMFFGDQAGQILGDKVGGWVNDLREADIPGKITSAWAATTSAISSGWDATTKLLRDGWDSTIGALKQGLDTAKGAAKAVTQWASEKANAANEFIKDKTGVDIKAGAEAVKDKAVDLGGKAVEGAKAGVEYLGNNTTVGKGLKAAGQGAMVVAEKIPAVAERAYNVTAATAGSALETVMPKGYRHKALFDGIKGGDSLTKYGSYTDEEATKIQELKTSGANTSANVKGGMSLEVQDKISGQAKKAGLDPVMMQKIAAMESGGNANAISSTGAAGIYQFTGQTASGVGIKNRFDVDQNIEGGMKLTKQNSAALEKSGLPVSAENLYMMHQLGPKAAQEVIRGAGEGKSKADMSPETQKAMNLNYGANSKTAADYIATNKKALDDRYAAVTKDTGGAPTAIAKANSSTPAAPPTAPDSSSVPHAVAQVAPPAVPPNVAAPAMPSVVASASMPSVPAMPSAQPVPSSPPMTVPMTGGDSDRPIQVSIPTPDVVQDIRDRQLAHIVTGGFSA